MKLAVVDLGRLAFDEAMRVQEEAVCRRHKDRLDDTLFLVEHDPVYTLGRNADGAHITATAEVLNARGISVRQTNRGGDVTYHGPGQIVGYPIIRLPGHGHGVLGYVSAIETMLIDTLACFGVEGTTHPANRGVWIGRDKIAAIGVRVSRHVTMHGFALNVSVNLDHYRHIIPCGLHDRGVTSLDRIIPNIAYDAVKSTLIRHFAQTLGYTDWGIPTTPPTNARASRQRADPLPLQTD